MPSWNGWPSTSREPHGDGPNGSVSRPRGSGQRYPVRSASGGGVAAGAAVSGGIGGVEVVLVTSPPSAGLVAVEGGTAPAGAGEAPTSTAPATAPTAPAGGITEGATLGTTTRAIETNATRARAVGATRRTARSRGPWFGTGDVYHTGRRCVWAATR